MEKKIMQTYGDYEFIKHLKLSHEVKITDPQNVVYQLKSFIKRRFVLKIRKECLDCSIIYVDVTRMLDPQGKKLFDVENDEIYNRKDFCQNMNQIINKMMEGEKIFVLAGLISYDKVSINNIETHQYIVLIKEKNFWCGKLYTAEPKYLEEVVTKRYLDDTHLVINGETSIDRINSVILYELADNNFLYLEISEQSKKLLFSICYKYDENELLSLKGNLNSFWESFKDDYELFIDCIGKSYYVWKEGDQMRFIMRINKKR
jgi:hypothetical protein